MTDRKFMDGADPSWYPRVLRTLERDYPGISNTVWSTAIGENAVEMVRKGQATAAAEAHPATEQPIDTCEHCEAPFSPGSPGHLNQDMTRWRHMACPACWICKRPLDEPAGPMGLLPYEWVEMADSRAGMAHTACFEGIREDL